MVRIGKLTNNMSLKKKVTIAKDQVMTRAIQWVVQLEAPQEQSMLLVPRTLSNNKPNNKW